MSAGEVDLDSFPPSTIQGIELYLGATTAPMKYTLSRDLSSCGTIILWSRGPDTDPITRAARPSRDLSRLVASLEVLTANQVDRPAELKKTPDVPYPPQLFAEGVTGRVVAEFVVDTLGRVEEGTFGVVSSTHPLFSEAVQRAVERETFAPAIRKGARARQLVQQPFTFAPGIRRKDDR